MITFEDLSIADELFIKTSEWPQWKTIEVFVLYWNLTLYIYNNISDIQIIKTNKEF